MRNVITVILAVAGLGLILWGVALVFYPAAMVLGGMASLRIAASSAKNGDKG